MNFNEWFERTRLTVPTLDRESAAYAWYAAICEAGRIAMSHEGNFYNAAGDVADKVMAVIGFTGDDLDADAGSPWCEQCGSYHPPTTPHIADQFGAALPNRPGRQLTPEEVRQLWENPFVVPVTRRRFAPPAE